MSNSGIPDSGFLDEQYHHYKVAVYDNLFGGMVYGRIQETCGSQPISEPLRPACDHRRLYHSLRDFGLRPPVSFACKEGGECTLMVNDLQEEPGFHFVSA